jgi:pimeloyl-ACP methyl ester carboxylesterase
MSKQIIYCIPGLGADEKIFSNLAVPNIEFKCVPWLKPNKNEPIEAYAARMATCIREKDAILLGVSFGGIIGVEIAKQVSLRKLILVSSIKLATELPRWMKISGRLRLHKLLPLQFYRFNSTIQNRRLGAINTEEKQMVRAYRRSADFQYVKWAIDHILNWKNISIPAHLVHIHGGIDKIFPVANIKADYVVETATHFMVFNKAKEISEIISSELQK